MTWCFQKRYPACSKASCCALSEMHLILSIGALAFRSTDMRACPFNMPLCIAKTPLAKQAPLGRHMTLNWSNSAFSNTYACIHTYSTLFTFRYISTHVQKHASPSRRVRADPASMPILRGIQGPYARGESRRERGNKGEAMA